MAGPYGKCLSSIGVLSPDGTITEEKREKFVGSVTKLIKSGNANGAAGGDPAYAIISSAMASVPGAEIAGNKMIHFNPDESADEKEKILKDKTKSAAYHAMFLDTLYAKTIASLDVEGSTPFFPIFDVTAAFPEIKNPLPIPFSPPELAIALKIPPFALPIKLIDVGLKLSIPKLPEIPIPTIPNVSLTVPGLPIPPLPKFIIIDLFLKLFELPILIIKELIIPPNISLVMNIPKMPTLVFEIGLNLLSGILLSFNFKVVPNVLVATLITWLKDIVGAICTLVVSKLVGSGGQMSKSVAGLFGLI